MDEIRSHVDYSIHESEEKRRVAELIPSAMTKAENIKRELKKTFEAEASHFRRLLEVHRRKQQVGFSRVFWTLNINIYLFLILFWSEIVKGFNFKH